MPQVTVGQKASNIEEHELKDIVAQLVVGLVLGSHHREHDLLEQGPEDKVLLVTPQQCADLPEKLEDLFIEAGLHE